MQPVILLIWALLLCSPGFAQAHPAPSNATLAPNLYNPVADVMATVVAGHARFTVLTPQLIRMEWDADGKFEDHASLVFLNRKLPVPEFSTTKAGNGHVDIDTGALRLHYTPQAGTDGRFSSTNLTVTLTLDGRPVIWHPGMPDTGNLQGTTRTLDGALGGKPKSRWIRA